MTEKDSEIERMKGREERGKEGYTINNYYWKK